MGLGVSNATTKLQVDGVISPFADATYNLGDSSLRFSTVYAQNGTINTSDAREKTEIKESDLGLEFISSLRPVSYRWKNGADSKLHYGLIAQEAEKAIERAKGTAKDANQTIVSYDKASDRYGMRYSELISPLIKAVQELSQKQDLNQKKIADYDKVVNELKTYQEIIKKLEMTNSRLNERLEALETAVQNK